MLSFTDMQRPFTFSELSGDISRSMGLLPQRQHSPGKQRFPRWHVRYPHPDHHPLPKR